jgi:hypothetical protein
MKTLSQIALASLLLSSATAMAAEIGLSATNTDEFTLGGTIAPECKVTTTGQNLTSLDLSQAAVDAAGTSGQQSAAVNTWCNTGADTVTTTISSLNNGNLVSGDGDSIAYTINLGDSTLGDEVLTGVSLNTDQTLELGVSTGANITTGEQKTRYLSVVPSVSGYEVAGDYQDTISVTVTAQ